MAFEKLAEDVENAIKTNPSTVMSMSELFNVYKGHLEEAGVFADNYRGHFLKSRLIRKFGDRLTFHRPCRRMETQYVFSSAVPPGPLIEFIKRQTESKGMSVSHQL